MYSLREKAWSPYAAGILIGLLQIPAFLLISTAPCASSSRVTVAGHLADAKNWWQVALVLAALLIMLLAITERWRPSSSELGGNVDDDADPLLPSGQCPHCSAILKTEKGSLP